MFLLAINEVCQEHELLLEILHVIVMTLQRHTRKPVQPELLLQ